MEINSGITGKTEVACLLGNPVEHSISPQLHNTLSRVMGVDLAYVAFKVEKDDLGSAVEGLRSLNVKGFNITVPYKEEILRYIDSVSEEAELIGAVNTVANAGGRLIGYNTDAEGFSRSFRYETGETFKNKSVALLGAGGAARAIAVKIASEGARNIAIINRTECKAKELALLINKNFGGIAGFFAADRLAEDVLGSADVVINSTPLGMYPHTEQCPLSNDAEFSKEQIVMDIIYNPGRTVFLQKAEKKGCKVINGLGMLVYQGIMAYEIWTGLKVPDSIAKDICRSFANYMNI